MKNEVQEMINRINGKIENTPMSHYSRVIIEREKDSEPIAVITNDDCEVADGFRVRLKPVYEKKKTKKLLKEASESPKQLQVKLSKRSFSEFVRSTIHDISSKD